MSKLLSVSAQLWFRSFRSHHTPKNTYNCRFTLFVNEIKKIPRYGNEFSEVVRCWCSKLNASVVFLLKNEKKSIYILKKNQLVNMIGNH